jgi:hypothetical protein
MADTPVLEFIARACVVAVVATPLCAAAAWVVSKIIMRTKPDGK